jgi:hypothetical protein
MVLWSRLSQGRVWDKLTHWLQDRFPQEPAGASAVSYQRAILGAEPLQWLFEHGTHVLCTLETAGAFYRGYRLMALDGSLFNVPDTQAKAAAFGRSCNQYGKGAYPQARAVMLTACGSHATVGLHLGDYDEAEIHGAYALLPKREPGHVADARCQLLWRRLSRSAQRQRGACAVRSAQHRRAGAGAQSARWQLPGTAYAAEAGCLSDAAATLATCHRVSGYRRASGRAWPRVSDRHHLAQPAHGSGQRVAGALSRTLGDRDCGRRDQNTPASAAEGVTFPHPTGGAKGASTRCS